MLPLHSPRGWLVATLLLSNSLVLGAESPSPVASDCRKGTAARGDEIWLVSSRHLSICCSDMPRTDELDVRRRDPVEGWQDSSLAEIFTGEPVLTVLYVHANRTSWEQSFQQGQLVFEYLASCGPDIPRFRFIIWSWPSDQIHGLKNDVQVKADRADAEGPLFGSFLQRFDPATPLGLIGYSYGSRIISGGLEYLAVNDVGNDRPIRAAYLAAAMDNRWLYPGNFHGNSLSQVDYLLIAYNLCDPALKRFRFSDPCTRPTALGYAGLNAGYLDRPDIIEQWDVSSMVGRTHDEDYYWSNSSILWTVCHNVLGGASTAVLPLDQPESVEEELREVAISAADSVDEQLTLADPADEAVHPRRLLERRREWSRR